MNSTVSSVEAPEVSIARDLARRALLVSPTFLVLGVVLDGVGGIISSGLALALVCLLYTSPSPRDISGSRMPSSA